MTTRSSMFWALNSPVALYLPIVVKPTTRSVLLAPMNSRSVMVAFGSAIAALMKPCGLTEIMNWRTSA